MSKAYTHLLKHRLRTGQVIALAAGAATLTLDVDPSYRHSFAGVEYVQYSCWEESGSYPIRQGSC